jgi:hypothetical protein
MPGWQTPDDAARWSAWARRWPIWCTVAAIIAAGVVLRGMPFEFWWGWFYGDLRGDLWWPLILFGLCWLFWATARFRHRTRGEPQFHPVAAGVVLLLCLWLLAIMVLFAAPHWSAMWSFLALGAVAAASYPLTLALVSYAEAWRVGCHWAVKATVCRQIETGEIEAALDDERTHARWGSLHGLAVIQREYQERKRVALSKASARGFAPELFEPAIKAGNALLLYLEVPWAESVLEEPLRLWLQVDTVRELLIMGLMPRAAGQQPLPSEREKDRIRVEDWMKKLRSTRGPARQFLVKCFELAFSSKPDMGGVHKILHAMRKHYSQDATDFRAPEGVQVDFRAIMQDTWLAVAHHSIPAQAVFDLWMEVRRTEGEGPFLGPLPSDAAQYDVALSAARRFLTGFYGDWARSSSPDWATGLDARRKWNVIE